MNANVHINHKMFEYLRQNKKKMYTKLSCYQTKKERKEVHLTNPSIYEN